MSTQRFDPTAVKKAIEASSDPPVAVKIVKFQRSSDSDVMQIEFTYTECYRGPEKICDYDYSVVGKYVIVGCSRWNIRTLRAFTTTALVGDDLSSGSDGGVLRCTVTGFCAIDGCLETSFTTEEWLEFLEWAESEVS